MSGCLKKAYSSFVSLAARMRFVPWSLQMVEGLPHRTIKCQRVAKKVAVKSVTSSRCIAFTVNDTKTQTYALVNVGLRAEPDLIQMGSAWSTPTRSNAGPGFKRSVGSCPSSFGHGLPVSH